MDLQIDYSTIDNMLNFASGRKRLIEIATVKHDDNWQDVGTPYDIAGEMVDLVKNDGTCYLVFFSLEFLEVMIHERGILPESILFITDYSVEGDLAMVAYGVKSAIVTKQMIMGDGKFDFGVAKSEICAKMVENELGEYGMKFNKVAVIGNPPYQVPDAGDSTGAKPIYHNFVEAAIDHLNPDYVSMIIPSRWMVGGKGLDKHRERMMNDTHMKKIVHFGGERAVFDTVQIIGGVNYFLWDKNYDGECEFTDGKSCVTRSLNQYDIILQDNSAFGIVNKILQLGGDCLDTKVSSRKPFGLPTNFNNFSQGGLTCFCNLRREKKVELRDIADNKGILDTIKVVMAYADGGAHNPDSEGKIKGVSNFFIIPRMAVCTETYLVINTFNSEGEAKNFIGYMNTKFFKFMLSLRTMKNSSKSSFAWVPDLQDYSAPWTDAELYKKFGLTRQEIAYIESKIKAI